MENDQLLKGIRRDLHREPETSGREEKTASKIVSYLEKFEPARIITGFAGYAVAAVYESGRPGPVTALRAELDALPIKEENNFGYASGNTGVSHACGHDGHMAILLGVAARLSEIMKALRGRVVLIFQPAEEVAAGAKEVAECPLYGQLGPDYIFALHNLPGFGLGDTVVKRGIFAIASRGMIARFKGASAHAGHPEQGKSPVYAMTDVITKLGEIGEGYNRRDRKAMITVIHARLGEIAFGTAPGDAVIMATLRAPADRMLEEISDESAWAVSEAARRFMLDYSVEWVEEFPATVNDDRAVSMVERAAERLNMKIVNLLEPFSWTEDFSYFLRKSRGALFGLGAGAGHSPLHSERYDFPDAILKNGVDIFEQLIRETHSSKEEE